MFLVYIGYIIYDVP